LFAVPHIAMAQTDGTAQQPPQYQPQYPPPQGSAQQQPSASQQQPSASQQQPSASQQQPPASQQQPPAAAPQGTGGGSQQVVVNPPPAAQTPQQQQPPAQGSASAVTVNPPPTAPGYVQTTPPVVEREAERRSSLEIVAIDAAYGGLAGLLVGGGVALIANNDNWSRDLMIGGGAGILVGAAVGGIHAYNVANDRPRDRYAMDGLGTPEKFPPLADARTVLTYGGKF
jgi:hypothetical protein